MHDEAPATPYRDPAGRLGLANALLGVILVAASVIEWLGGAPLDAAAVLRMGVFVGIVAMGWSQYRGLSRGVAMSAAVWTLVCAAAFLATRL